MNRFRLTTIRECRVPTPMGWGLFSMVVGLILFFLVLFAYPFLAPTQPVGGKILLVEGWLPDYALEKAKALFLNDNYKLVVTTGGGFSTDHPLAQYKTLANWTALRLNKQGVPLGKIIPVPVTIISRKDRTYHKALAVKSKLNEMGLTQASIDVVSFGVHARRTWVLFEKAFPSVDVGIISIRPNSYDTSRWWSSSAGVRAVISEAIAYLYARFIFSPPIK